LEHYAAHLSDSRKAARSEELMHLLRDESYVLTQKKVLQNYKATSLLLRACLLKAGELQRREDQLEAALGLVDLRYEESNDAPLVVAMVGRGEIDAALRRIEAFGGSDKEGMRRKFTLYMLCLMELTLLGGKDKHFRKTAIDSLLRHLDENLPTDFSILKWNDFFPSYLIFLVACECAATGADYGVLYKRTDDWETDWIAQKGPYTDQQFQVLTECARGISSDRAKSSALKEIAVELSKQGQVEESASVMQESLAIARGISYDWDKSYALKDIAVELSKQGQVEESLAIARGIICDYMKSSALKDIAVELRKQGQAEESASVMQESLAIARGIIRDHRKNSVLKAIAVELSNQGQLEESLAIARGINAGWLAYKSALKDFAVELSKQGNWTMAESVLLEVSRAGERHEGWQEMAKAVVEAEGWQKALRQAVNFQSEEARLFYSKGWSRQVGITDVDDACVREALPLLGDDPESIQSLLEKYAIRLVSMGTPTKAFDGRLNRTLNIQWLLDITAKYPNSATHDRLSTNLEEWLPEISDEDDREQITLWARQVVKGRLTELEFAELLKDINSNQT
jgi:tetratricopeptide (TPR) repeat protein